MDMIALSVILLVLIIGVSVAIASFFVVRYRDRHLSEWSKLVN